MTTLNKPEEQTPSLDDQFQIYAKELGDLYKVERQRRSELAEEKLVLEQRLKELEALNRMFQRHLARRIELEDAFKELVEQLRTVSKEASAAKLRQELVRVTEDAYVRILADSLTEEALLETSDSKTVAQD